MNAQRTLLLAAIVLHFTSRACGQDRPEGKEVLDRFVGVWKTAAVDKPAKWQPMGRRRTLEEAHGKILKDRYVLGREICHAEGTKVLWLMTHDPATGKFPFWYFDNRGVFGGEWSGVLEEGGKSVVFRATDTPPGWTSRGFNRLTDERTIDVGVWMKDENGTLLMDATAKKVRQPADASKEILAHWSKTAAAADLPAELKVLERLAGSWTAEATLKRAEWTPKEIRQTSRVERTWVLDGRFLQDRSKTSDGAESFSLLAYDPGLKAFRGWWFDGEGHSNKSKGSWNEAAATLTLVAELDGGLEARSTCRIHDADHHTWQVQVRDAAGKRYFDGEWKVARRN